MRNSAILSCSSSQFRLVLDVHSGGCVGGYDHQRHLLNWRNLNLQVVIVSNMPKPCIFFSMSGPTSSSLRSIVDVWNVVFPYSFDS